MKPGGWAILQVPTALTRLETEEEAEPLSATERERRFGQDDHVRLCGQDCADRLERAGFEVARLDGGSLFGAGSVDRFGLFPGEKLYVARKCDCRGPQG